MATAQTIIKATFRKLGIRNPSNDDLAYGLEALNDLLTSWSGEKLLTHVNVREAFTLSIGQSTYTWGSGGNITTARPIDIEDIYVRDSNGNDYPIDIITEEFYNDIILKTNQGRPDRVYYATEYPLSKIFLYPTPNAAETLQISSWKALSEISLLTSTVSLPNEYRRALIYNLLLDIASEFGYEPSPNEHDIAEKTKDILRNVNSKDMVTQFPNAITKGNLYNIDTFYRRF